MPSLLYFFSLSLLLLGSTGGSKATVTVCVYLFLIMMLESTILPGVHCCYCCCCYWWWWRKAVQNGVCCSTSTKLDWPWFKAFLELQICECGNAYWSNQPTDQLRVCLRELRLWTRTWECALSEWIQRKKKSRGCKVLLFGSVAFLTGIKSPIEAEKKMFTPSLLHSFPSFPSFPQSFPPLNLPSTFQVCWLSVCLSNWYVFMSSSPLSISHSPQVGIRWYQRN